MTALLRTLPFAFVAAALLVPPAPAAACNIPVFRYAVDHWPSDPYRFTVYHRGPLESVHANVLRSLDRFAHAAAPTIAIELVDLTKSPQGAKGVALPPADAELPWLTVRYPAATRIGDPVWAGPLDAGAVSALLDSAARRELARRIRGGDSAVWVLLASGDAAKDDAVEKKLKAELQRLEKELKLPERTAAPEDQPLDEAARPVRLVFSALRVGRSDPAEQMLVRMLLNTEDDLTGRTEPMVFPVFGRGRAMPALVGAGITTENLGEAAGFLAGPCTCQVKRDNPGVDMLMTADWSALKPAEVFRAKEGTLVPIPRGPDPAPASGMESAASPWPRYLLFGGIGAAGLLVVVTGARAFRARR